jgi:hypothetical protein
LHAVAHAADFQDRDDGALPTNTICNLYPFLPQLYADSGYPGPQFKQRMRRACEQIDGEIIKRPDAAKFLMQSKRWIERTVDAVDSPRTGNA